MAPRPQSRAKRPPRARKALGQHFLRDSGVLADIADGVHVPPGGLLVEIGPGTGQLTAVLVQRFPEVVALEVEPRMLRYLAERFQDADNLRLVEADARTVDWATVVEPGRPYSVVGNLPYFAANPIIRHLMEGSPQPVQLVVMVQREVAREITAEPGQLSILGISVQIYAEPEHLFDVPPEAFEPPPNVHSSVIRLRVRSRPLVPPERIDAFFRLVTQTFRNPRKQIHNALSRGAALPEDGATEALTAAGIDIMRRPETLSIDEWLRLLDACEAVQANG